VTSHSVCFCISWLKSMHAGRLSGGVCLCLCCMCLFRSSLKLMHVPVHAGQLACRERRIALSECAHKMCAPAMPGLNKAHGLCGV
jgi:hypothetical protein